MADRRAALVLRDRPGGALHCSRPAWRCLRADQGACHLPVDSCAVLPAQATCVGILSSSFGIGISTQPLLNCVPPPLPPLIPHLPVHAAFLRLAHRGCDGDRGDCRRRLPRVFSAPRLRQADPGGAPVRDLFNGTRWVVVLAVAGRLMRESQPGERLMNAVVMSWPPFCPCAAVGYMHTHAFARPLSHSATSLSPSTTHALSRFGLPAALRQGTREEAKRVFVAHNAIWGL